METSPLTKYLLFQIYSARQLAANVSKDADPEYLHKFRVALRRSRSLLELYLPDSYAIGEVLKTLFKTTNELRELDVFLLSIDSEKYPKLYKKLKQHRDRRYDTIWEPSFFKHTSLVLDKIYDDLCNLNEHLDPDNLVGEALEGYEKNLNAYRKLNQDAAAKELHKLRIEFKISRYALEFVKESGIKQVEEEVERCKKIQDELGAVQDAKNQLKLLKDFCKTSQLEECRKLLEKRKKHYRKLKQQATSSQSA